MSEEKAGFENFLQIIALRSEAANGKTDGDYIKDGIIYCGKCNTPKQAVVKINGLTIKPFCMCKCKTEEKEREKAEYERRKREDRIRENRSRAFVEADFAGCTFEKDDRLDPKISDAMKRYADNFETFRKDGKGLLLYGGCGTGKTYFAACVANDLLDKGYRVMMTNFSYIINVLQSGFDGRQEYLDRLCNVDLLVLDDLGIESGSEYRKEMIYTIIDGRYKAGKPMIITTNLHINSMKNQTDISLKRIYDRIMEKCFPVEVEGKNRRYGKIKDEYADMKNILGL